MSEMKKKNKNNDITTITLNFNPDNLATFDEQKKEAVRRMKLYKMDEQTISEFYDKNIIPFYSPNGCFSKSELESIFKFINETNNEHHVCIYNVITAIENNKPKKLIFYFVSQFKDQWENETIKRNNYYHNWSLITDLNYDKKYYALAPFMNYTLLMDAELYKSKKTN